MFGSSPPRSVSAFAATCCLVLGGWLALNHPIAPLFCMVALMLWSAAVFLRPGLWLFLIPALLPVIDLAPRTGWLIVEEFDLLVLGAAAGAYAAIAWRGSARGTGMLIAKDGRLSAAWVTLIWLVGIWTVFALFRGMHGTALTEMDWFDGYYSGANGLRVAKSYLLTLLMLPPLLVETRRSDARTTDMLGAGLVAGLVIASLAIIWERLAFPGLLNFSSDYRTTALFWEMHVGGAALDGFLALTAPFAVREVLVARSGVRRTLAVLCLLLEAYACLTTFSRGVYLAVPISIGLLGFLLLARGSARAYPSAALAILKGCALIGVMCVLSHFAFRAGGYRSLLAVLGVFALTLPFGTIARGIPARPWVAGTTLGLLAGMAGSAMAMFLLKGIYFNFALAFVGCSLFLFLAQQAHQMRLMIASLGAYIWLIMAAAGVALGWGGVSALQDTALVLTALIALMLWNVRAQTPLWPDSLPLQVIVVALASLVAIATAVLSAGAYMTGRISDSERDLGGRLQHWRDGIGMLSAPADWFLGKGAGRFPEEFLFRLVDREYPGSARIGAQDGERHLVLFGPRREAGFGEVFRVAQQVSLVPGATYSVVLDVRSEKVARLHLELCERRLLYVEKCAISASTVPATGESWQRQILSLDGAKIKGGPWFAPRPVFFAMAIESPGTSVVVDNVSLIGPDGRELLGNGNFAEGMARWFTTSDRFHLPWHIKNIGLNLLFDQGMIGLLLFALLSCAALCRLVAGVARAHPFAPFLAAALVGFLLVGMFDSLLDVPRVAFLYYLVLMMSVVLPKATPPLVNFTKTREDSGGHRSSAQS